MWWEHSECGSHVERTRAPAAHGECGTVGVIFVPVDADDQLENADDLRAVWLHACLAQARLTEAA